MREVTSLVKRRWKGAAFVSKEALKITKLRKLGCDQTACSKRALLPAGATAATAFAPAHKGHGCRGNQLGRPSGTRWQMEGTNRHSELEHLLAHCFDNHRRRENAKVHVVHLLNAVALVGTHRHLCDAHGDGSKCARRDRHGNTEPSVLDVNMGMAGSYGPGPVRRGADNWRGMRKKIRWRRRERIDETTGKTSGTCTRCGTAATTTAASSAMMITGLGLCAATTVL